MTTATRTALLPGVPAVSETLRGYGVTRWYGLGGPRSENLRPED